MLAVDSAVLLVETLVVLKVVLMVVLRAVKMADWSGLLLDYKKELHSAIQRVA
jgi:hypothetical protein